MDDLSFLKEEEIKERLETLRKEYKDLIKDLAPRLKKANLIENEITLLVTELEKRK